MRAIYMVRNGAGYWTFVTDEKDWWTKRLADAAQFTSLHKAKRLAKRTGGEVVELVPTLVRGPDK